MKALLVSPLVTLLLLSGCAQSKTEEIIDHATVVADRASVRAKNSSTSRTLQVLAAGEKVEVLERDGNWFRIRYDEQLQGWMEETTLVTSAMQARVQEMVAASQNLQPQNTAVLSDSANFRIEPGRTTPVIRRLDQGTSVEVLDRLTILRPGTPDSAGSNDTFDVWLKVRRSPVEIGWVYSGLLDFDTPPEIGPYSEGYAYPAVKVLSRVQDSITGPVNLYVVGERKQPLDPNIDFQGIRVFTWNMGMHRYETALRIKGLRGVYPLEVGQEEGNPAFHINELSGDGSTKTRRHFVLIGGVVREKKVS